MRRGRADKLIGKARAEYEETLRQIANREQDLPGRGQFKYTSIPASVESVIPPGGAMLPPREHTGSDSALDRRSITDDV